MSVESNNPFLPIQSGEPSKKPEEALENFEADPLKSKIGEVAKNRLKDHPLTNKTGSEVSFHHVTRGPVGGKENIFEDFKEKPLENLGLEGIDREKAEKILKDKPLDSWLIRNKENPKQTIISHKKSDGIHHLLVPEKTLKEAEKRLDYEFPVSLRVNEESLFDNARNYAELGQMPFRALAFLNGENKNRIIKMFLSNQTKHFPGVDYTSEAVIREARKLETEDAKLGQRDVRDLSPGSLSRDEAVQLLAGKPNGSWLVRYSVNEKRFVISFKNDKGIFHIKVSTRTVEETEADIHRILPENLRVVKT